MRRPETASLNRAPRRWVSLAVRPALCLALLLALPGGAQNPPPQPLGGFGQQTDRHSDDPLAERGVRRYPAEDEMRLRALNVLRQKSLVEDTNKLLKLAAELNAEVSSAHPDALTSEQLHKLAAIEKLARSVKEKMSAPVLGIPAFSEPFSPSLR
jgi:hypothetical protein